MEELLQVIHGTLRMLDAQAIEANRARQLELETALEDERGRLERKRNELLDALAGADARRQHEVARELGWPVHKLGRALATYTETRPLLTLAEGVCALTALAVTKLSGAAAAAHP